MQGATIEVGDTHATIQSSSGAVKTARIIHAERDESGDVVYALLDRRIHDNWASYRGWDASGCYVTELRRS